MYSKEQPLFIMSNLHVLFPLAVIIVLSKPSLFCHFNEKDTGKHQ